MENQVLEKSNLHAQIMCLKYLTFLLYVHFNDFGFCGQKLGLFTLFGTAFCYIENLENKPAIKVGELKTKFHTFNSFYDLIALKGYFYDPFQKETPITI